MLNSPGGLGAVRRTRERAGTTPLPRVKWLTNDNDDLHAPPLPDGFQRPDFALTGSSRGRLPEFDELVMRDERDELAQ
eukprot:7932884-Pyramimonas_sp.AAC.1